MDAHPLWSPPMHVDRGGEVHHPCFLDATELRMDPTWGPGVCCGRWLLPLRMALPAASTYTEYMWFGTLHKANKIGPWREDGED